RGGADDSWRLPEWRRDPSRKGHAKARDVQIRLRIHDATVQAPRPYGRATGFGLEAIADLGSRTRVRLERMSWAAGPWDSKLEGMTADLTAGSSGVRARLGGVSTPAPWLGAE